MTLSLRGLICLGRSSANRESVSSSSACRGLKSDRAARGHPGLPPASLQVNTLASERSRFDFNSVSVSLSPRFATKWLLKGIVAGISESTLRRWLPKDAMRPWRHRSWICPRDPQFAKKLLPYLICYHQAPKTIVSRATLTRLQRSRVCRPSGSHPASLRNRHGHR